MAAATTADSAAVTQFSLAWRAGDASAEALGAVAEALTALAEVDERKNKVVELRFFGGLTKAEITEALQVSPETVWRDWRLAKAWLLKFLSGGHD